MRNERISLSFASANETAYALSASPEFETDEHCFAATSHGLYRSIDGGGSWELLRLADALPDQIGVTAVAVSPAFARDRTVFAAVLGGILRSSDGGDTWFAAAFPAPPPLFTAIAISPDFERDGLMLAGAMEDGVFSSTDRGVNWQPWNFGLFDLGVLCLATSPHLHLDETVFAGTETGLYHSTNGGRAWRESGFPSKLAPVLSLAYLSRDDETLLFAGTEEHGLYVSANDGASWLRIDADMLGGSVNQLHVRNKPDGGAEIYALTDDGIFCSCDAAENWDTFLQTERPPTAMLAPDSSLNTLFVGLIGRGIVRYEL